MASLFLYLIAVSTLFGGPSQPEPYDHRGGIQNARRSAATSESIVNPNQYENDDVSIVRTVRTHYALTPPELESARSMDWTPDPQATTSDQRPMCWSRHVWNYDRIGNVLQPS